MNVVVVRGRLRREPVERQVRGGHVVDCEVTVATEGGASDVVPITWPGAPARVHSMEAGTEVVVTGRVRRRFFRAGGVTQSRTEVVADTIVPARHSKRVAAAVAGACERARRAAGGQPAAFS